VNQAPPAPLNSKSNNIEVEQLKDVMVLSNRTLPPDGPTSMAF